MSDLLGKSMFVFICICMCVLCMRVVVLLFMQCMKWLAFLHCSHNYRKYHFQFSTGIWLLCRETHTPICSSWSSELCDGVSLSVLFTYVRTCTQVTAACRCIDSWVAHGVHCHVYLAYTKCNMLCYSAVVGPIQQRMFQCFQQKCELLWDHFSCMQAWFIAAY